MAGERGDPAETITEEDPFKGIAPTVPMRLAPGTVLGHFVLEKVLGVGGMGVVYVAHDKVLERKVAIKILSLHAARDLSAMRARLLREARAASLVVHPNVVTVHEAGQVGDQVFVAMELVDGGTLADWLAARPRGWREIVPIFISAGRGLVAVHAAGLVHRDFKPANVLVGRDGRVRVCDFGIVGWLDAAAQEVGRSEGPPEPSPIATRASAVLGTPRYMSPEQHAGSRVDAMADQFSFAVSLFEALAGVSPYPDATWGELRASLAAGAPRPLPAAVPRWLAQAVYRGLAIDAGRRFPSMAALVEVLERGLASSPRRRWRRWAPAILATGAVAALGVRALQPPPRGPARATVVRVDEARRLTVAPGCEEYPRFLPGATAVVYDGLIDGDYEILRLELDSGSASRLTRDPGWDYGSSVSSDGRLAAYVHQGETRELRIVATDGKSAPRSLGSIPVGYPTWTDDGAILIADGGAHVWRVELDGTTRALPIALPSGARVQHLLELPGHGVAAVFLRSNDIPTMALAEIGPAGAPRVVEPTLIDDEAGLARAPARDAYYATAGGAAGSTQVIRRRWGGAAEAVPGALSAHAGLDVSADGKRLIFSTCSGRSHLLSMPRDRPPRPLPRGEWGDVYPRRVDDHRYLVTSGRGGPQQVWLLDDTGAARALAGPQTSSGVATLAGDRIAYVDSAQGGLFTVGLDGGDPRRLTSDATDTSPSFTRDGRDVLFQRSAPGEPARVWRVPAEGGVAEPLGPPGTYHPAASPIDDVIVAVDLTGPGPQVVLLEHGHARPLGLAGTRPRFSPDGRRILVIQDDMRVAEWRRDGATPPTVVWQATTEAVFAADYLDDDDVVASVAEYTGDLWLAQGQFP